MMLRIGVWNVRGLNGKEIEVEDEFIKNNLDILAITETKKKGEGKATMEQTQTLIYSGVKQEERAKTGVGVI